MIAIADRSMIRWRLRELMSRYRISNRDLAEALGRHETSVSRLKSGDSMPRLNGKELSQLCDALTQVLKDNGERHVITHVDLFEYVPDDREA